MHIETFTTILLWGLLSPLGFVIFGWISGKTWMNSISIGKSWSIIYRYSTNTAWAFAIISVLDVLGWILVASKYITDLIFF